MSDDIDDNDAMLVKLNDNDHDYNNDDDVMWMMPMVGDYM